MGLGLAPGSLGSRRGLFLTVQYNLLCTLDAKASGPANLPKHQKVTLETLEVTHKSLSHSATLFA